MLVEFLQLIELTRSPAPAAPAPTPGAYYRLGQHVRACSIAGELVFEAVCALAEGDRCLYEATSPGPTQPALLSAALRHWGHAAERLARARAAEGWLGEAPIGAAP